MKYTVDHPDAHLLEITLDGVRVADALEVDADAGYVDVLAKENGVFRVIAGGFVRERKHGSVVVHLRQESE